MQNLFDFESTKHKFNESDFSAYGAIIRKLRAKVMNTFKIHELYFTAPTFITRLDGREDWNPNGKPPSPTTLHFSSKELCKALYIIFRDP